MTEKQALSEGLHFTGIYDSADKYELKKRASEIRKKYKCRAVLVDGDSVYADRKCEVNVVATSFKNQLSAIEEKKFNLRTKYWKDLKAIEDHETKMKAYLKENEELIVNC